jgi:glycosyltransferase involved in cell wall biosynthesis
MKASVAVPGLTILELFQPSDGGVPDHVLRLGGGLLARGQRVLVGGPPDAAPRAALERLGATYAPIRMRGDMLAPRADTAALRKIVRLVRSARPDVVHVHGQKAALLGRVAAAWAGAPALYSPHGLVYRTQLLRPRRSARARRVATLAAERALGRRTAALTACSEDERAAAVRDGLVPLERACVVDYGVDPDGNTAPDPELVAFRGDGPMLGLVAGLREQKGVPTLLDALEQLAARGEPVRFAIVGNGPLRAAAEARAARPPLAGTLLVKSFDGRVEPYLRALDGFVLPSLWEGLPIAVLEAMAMGLPVVATAVNGTPEAVREGETGYLVPVSDPDALARRMAALAEDGDGRARMGARAREIARRHFTVERMVDEMLAVYRAAAAGRPPPWTGRRDGAA